MGRLVLNETSYSGNESNGHLYGENAPRDTQGTEGAYYYQYVVDRHDDGQGNITITPREIVCVYSKIDGHWVPFNEQDVPPDRYYSVVVANPSGAATAPLEKISIDDGIYSINASGSTVVPNPIGTPSADLAKVEIDGVLFSVNGIGTPVVANPTGSSGSDLTRVKIDGTDYNIPGTAVVANPSGTATADLAKLSVNGTVYGIPESVDVEGNPSGTATTTLTKLKVDNTIFGIDTGTTVVANPSDTASSALNKLKVGSDTYSIPSGGSDVQGNPSGTATVDLVKLGIDGTIYGIETGSEVEANPSETGSTTLTKLKVDGTVYNVPSGGGGGSTVVPNPTGTAVGTLTSIGIDGDKYTIEGGGGTALPDNYNPTSQYLKITTPNQYNELGWAVNDDTYYTESTDGYYVGDTHVTKSNALPALGGSVGGGYYQVIYTSTDRTSVNTSGSSVSTGSFSYLDHTWYYNASGNLMSKPTGVPYMGNIGSNYVNISKKMIDESGVYFASYQNTFTQVGTPLSGHLFSGGGTQSNLSDATFDVETDGTVHGTDFQINDVSVMEAFTGATSSTAGVKGMVPAPASGDQNKFLQGDGTWGTAAKEQELTFAEYQSLTPVQQEDGTTYYVTDLNMNGSGDQFRPVIYSEAEMEIGVWTDGRPLYQKTLALTTPSSINSNSMISDLSSLQIDTLVHLEGYIYATSLGQTVPIAWSYNTSTMGAVYYQSGSLYQNLSSSPYCSCSEHITIQYTKTTDAAGSGTWTPQGVPAIHYSTGEQVVGTWIDGSTIYEKTLYVASLNTSDNQITHNINNFNRIIHAEGSVIRGTGNSAKQLCIPYASPDGQTWSLGIYEFTNSGFLINVGSSYNSSYSLTDCYVTIRYTKNE